MKSWVLSKTIWYNLATAAALLVAALGQYGVVPNAEIVNIGSELNLILAPLVNIFLRKVTTTGISI